MILNKALLIKGLVGTTSVLGIGTAAYLNKDKINEWLGTSNSQDEDQKEEIETELIKKVGLDCKTPSTAGTECTKLTTEGSKINIKQSEETSGDFEITELTSSSGSGKIKLYKLENGNNTDNYHKGLKFVIEDGDITKESNKTLEEFETYEIKVEGENESKKYYLKRKFTKPQAIKKALGLPEGCDLSSNGTCSEVTVNSSNIGQIKFDGVSGNQNPSITGTAKLIVSKENTDTDFPHKFKFSFKASDSSSTITISNTKSFTLDTTKGTEFKIKKSGSSLTLEKAWTLNKLLEKVGLTTCTTNNTECNIKDNDGLKVKQGDGSGEKNKTRESNNGGSGKIKLSSSNDTDYEHGFKFVIEDGDINFGSSGGSITKLEQFETYEIKKDDSSSDWYLTRKKDALEEKKRILGLPSDDESCKLPTDSDTKTCTLDATKLKAIKFEGKNSSSDTTMDIDGSTVNLKITKTSDSPFTDGGYKFVFETTQSNITIPKSSSGSIYIKKNTNTEFKIKKSGNTLTLEKAWTVTELAKQVGLTCPAEGSDKECTLPTSEPSLKLYNSDSDKTENGKVADNTKKLKYAENVEGHNQGFKFYTEDDITLEGNDNKKIEKKGDSNTISYEIKQQTSGNETKWYLSKVTSSNVNT